MSSTYSQEFKATGECNICLYRYMGLAKDTIKLQIWYKWSDRAVGALWAGTAVALGQRECLGCGSAMGCGRERYRLQELCGLQECYWLREHYMLWE